MTYLILCAENPSAPDQSVSESATQIMLSALIAQLQMQSARLESLGWRLGGNVQLLLSSSGDPIAARQLLVHESDAPVGDGPPTTGGPSTGRPN